MKSRLNFLFFIPAVFIFSFMILFFLKCDQGTPGTGDNPTFEECWGHKTSPDLMPINYDQYDPVIGHHCYGTDHQNIDGDIELVVFLGDSITYGTPPTLPWNWYRFRLMRQLRNLYGNDVEFRNYSAWGDRTDDLLADSEQAILQAFPTLPEMKKTLVIMTCGGNDLHALAKKFLENNYDVPMAMEIAVRAVNYFEEAIKWFYADPARFPRGVNVIFSNNYEFTDATGDVTSCPTACWAADLCEPLPPSSMSMFMNYLNEEYMRIATTTGTDMIFLVENFCGHGFHHDDPLSPCYQPDSARWMDITCIHPNALGHQAIATMFMSVITDKIYDEIPVEEECDGCDPDADPEDLP